VFVEKETSQPEKKKDGGEGQKNQRGPRGNPVRNRRDPRGPKEPPKPNLMRHRGSESLKKVFSRGEL